MRARRTTALLVLAAACGGDGESTASSPSGPVVVPAEATPLESLEPAPLFPDRKRRIRPTVLQNLRFSDPSEDGWETEAWAEEAERALATLFAAALSGESGPEGSLAPDFRGASALCGELDAPRGGVATAVEVAPGELWSAERGEPLGADLAAQLTPPVEDWGAPGAVLAEVFRIRADQGGELETRALVQIPFERDGARTQYNGLWSARWKHGASGLQLLELRRAEAEVARAPQPLFEDWTAAAFGASECFEDELRRDPEAYFFQSDRLTEYDMFGNHGFALGDVDGDGRDDVYVCMPAGLPNRLFLVQADGTTREVARERGVAFADITRSALILDLDDDGHRDLIAGVGAGVVVAWNDGERFGERALLPAAGADDVYGLSAADVDGDGDLDLYASRYGTGVVRESSKHADRGPARMMRRLPTPYHDAFNGASNVYWRNEGGRAFVDATAEVGLDDQNSKFSFGAVWEDFDEDGDLDLYVTNDFGRNHHYVNEGGRFRDLAAITGTEDLANGMGPSCADFDLDGDLDLYISNIYAAEGVRITDQTERFLRGRAGELIGPYRRLARGNTLYRNRGDGTFDDVSTELRANRGGWAWGARFADLDNDRYEDLFVPNGWFSRPTEEDVDGFYWRFVIARSPSDEKTTQEYMDAMLTIEHLAFQEGLSWNGNEPNTLLLNRGGERFVDATALCGLEGTVDGRAVAAVDWDRDGRLDLLVKNRNAPRLQLLRNAGGAGAADWLVLELDNGLHNRDAVGATVRVHAGGVVQRRAVVAGDGFLSQSPRQLHFGLGAAESVEAVEVRWPDGERQRFDGGLEPGRAYALRRGTDEPLPLAWEPLGAPARAGVPVAPIPGLLKRVVLCAELPLAPLRLPSFQDPERRVRDFAGAPLVVTLWSDADELSRGQVLRLAREREALAAAGVVAVPLSIDEGPGLVRARRTSESLGFGDLVGFLDGKRHLALEVLLGEVLPRTGNIPLGATLLLDGEGRLCVIYTGPVRVADLLADAAVVTRSKTPADDLWGGEWLAPPARDFAALAAALEELGHPELAAFYGQCAASR